MLVPAAQESPSGRNEEPVVAMLDRWEAEDVGDEPDWDPGRIERLSLRTH